MPNWQTASMSDTCSIAYSVVFALRLPSSANGSIWERFADTTANSAATKKALPASSRTSQTSPIQSLIGSHPPARPPVPPPCAYAAGRGPDSRG